MAYQFSLVVFAVLLYVQYGQAIRCWTCSSDLDPQCGDPFNSTGSRFNLHHALTDCNTQAGPSFGPYRGRSVCKKIKQVVNGDMVVIRSCAWLRPDENLAGECPDNTRTPSYIKVEYCETCDGDQCNSAPSLFKTYLLPMAISSVLALLLLK